MTSSAKTNHLIHETSPYLLQHAHNPVDWYPWGQEALNKAQQENKPILLSIGYAACHWCHVMAHESFADEETANLMNQFFINIKVDREERPDLDKIYQTAHYLLTHRSGGWPLTIFLSPYDLVPFYSGTYFPKESRYQLPAFKEILQGIATAYYHQALAIQQQNAELRKILHYTPPVSTPTLFNQQPLELALQSLQKNYDSAHGGFNGVPKFPQASRLEFLLHQDPSMTINTLQQMAIGGIYDQLGGGFYRYTIDAEWQIPHFEKMLYDNGQLLSLYALAYQQSKHLLFATIAHATANWILQKMQSAEGGFYSSIDADSEGKEGQYYVWKKEQVKTILSADEYTVIELYYGFNQPPNFENQWHLHIAQSISTIATLLNKSPHEITILIETSNNKLLAEREKRTPPTRDDKILTAWNGLTIKGLLIAGDKLEEPRFIVSSQQALQFIQQTLWKDKRLFASYKNEKAPLMAYLDDYVYLLDALLTALQIHWHEDYLTWAVELTEALLTYFYDQTAGGFFFTAHDHERLLYRPKTMMDEAIPAGNGVAIQCLLTLGYLLGETRYLSAAEKTLQNAWALLTHHPAEHCSVLLGLKMFLAPPPIIIIRGTETEIKIWRDACKNIDNFVFAIPSHEKNLPAALAEKKSSDNTCAYVCRGTQCSAVIEDLTEFKKITAKF